VQYCTGRRVADVDDLILNTVGGVLGYGLLRLSLARRAASVDAEKPRPAGGVSSHSGGPS
jgi:glycopeptide antibiotics resistance protein